MNGQRIAAGMNLLFAVMLLAGLPGCQNKDQPDDSAQTPAAGAELAARLQKEINETRVEIAEAEQLQDKLAAEIKVLKQLQAENQAELTTHEAEVSRLETQRSH